MENKDKNHKNHEVMASLLMSLNELRRSKPNDRSESDRRYAVTITNLEEVIAYFDTFVIRGKG